MSDPYNLGSLPEPIAARTWCDVTAPNLYAARGSETSSPEAAEWMLTAYSGR
jgi:hypothetical protein